MVQILGLTAGLKDVFRRWDPIKTKCLASVYMWRSFSLRFFVLVIAPPSRFSPLKNSQAATMGKKKPFIDNKSASTFHLLHRSQRDVANLVEGDTHAAEMVLWSAEGNRTEPNDKVLQTGDAKMMQAWRERLDQAGMLAESPDKLLSRYTRTFWRRRRRSAQ